MSDTNGMQKKLQIRQRFVDRAMDWQTEWNAVWIYVAALAVLGIVGGAPGVGGYIPIAVALGLLVKVDLIRQGMRDIGGAVEKGREISHADWIYDLYEDPAKERLAVIWRTLLAGLLIIVGTPTLLVAGFQSASDMYSWMFGGIGILFALYIAILRRIAKKDADDSALKPLFIMPMPGLFIFFAFGPGGPLAYLFLPIAVLLFFGAMLYQYNGANKARNSMTIADGFGIKTRPDAIASPIGDMTTVDVAPLVRGNRNSNADLARALEEMD